MATNDGASGGFNTIRSVMQAADGGFVAAGYGNSNNTNLSGLHGAYDATIFKTDNNGTLQWSKLLGGLNTDYFTSIKNTTDGGYIAAGVTSSIDGDVTSNHGNSDVWVVKLNATGNIQWQKTYGGSLYDSATSIQQTKDGGYIVAGRTSSNDGNVSGNHGGYDYWVIKLDAAGNITWQKAYGGIDDDIAYAIQQTADGGYIVGGRSSSNDGDISGNHGGMDYWIIKINSNGVLQWTTSLGGSNDDICYSVLQTKNGKYIVAGSTTSEDGNVTGFHGPYNFPDFWIVKLNESGGIISVIQSKDGGYLLGGYTGSTDGDVGANFGNGFTYNCWLVKLSADVLPITLLSFDGSIQNTNAILNWRTTNEVNNKGFEVQKSFDGRSFAKIGYVTGAGSIAGEHRYNYTDVKVINGANYYRLKQIDNDGKFSYSPVIKLDYSKFDWSALGNPSKNIWVQLQLDKKANVAVQLVSMNGTVMQTINKGSIDKGTYSIPINAGKNATGMYVVKLLVDNNQYTKKIIVTK